MAKEFASWFYNSLKWQKARTAYMISKYYICERCGGAATIVHHIKPITPENIHDPHITLDPENLKAVCDDCHAIEHIEDTRSGKPARLNGIAFDENGNVIRQPNVFLVCGSPSSGKSTYVSENKTEKDIVLDVDYICAALMGEPDNIYANHAYVIEIAVEVRALLHKLISARRGKWERAFVITTTPNIKEIKALSADLNAEIIMIDTDKEECLRRLEKDTRRINNKRIFVNLIVKWFEAYNQWNYPPMSQH
ncbi:MAG: AAA family ATPase [Clostridiales bacterium]|jgi:predicted kinase|nr:AAA family ATPase [Clostridiales bacterium]